MTKYLINKGWEGFGDRLECLSYAVTNAKRFNRILYVDWNDTIWKEGFYRYFHFVDLPYTDQLNDIADSLTVWPSFWQYKLMLPANEWIHEDTYKFLNEFKPMEGVRDEDVWVLVGVGYREWNWPDLQKHLRLNKETIEEIGSIPVDLPVVHLRGTDRNFSEESWQALKEKVSVARVIGDDYKLIKRWIEESPESIVQSEPIEGIYHKSIAPKHKQNISLLRDFMTLSEANEAYALNDESIFFKHARSIDTKTWRAV
jgi:hypothetical protein